MEIEIIQKKFTFILDKYDIYVDKLLTYKSKSSFFTFTSKILIVDVNNQEKGFVEKESSFFNNNLPRYNLNFGNCSSIRLIADSFTHYQLPVPQGTVHIYEQKGRKLGLFFNDKQIGVIEKNKTAYFGGDKYLIIIDSECIEKELAIAFTLAYDDFFSSNNDSILNVDYGNVSIDTEKTIDPNWKPKN